MANRRSKKVKLKNIIITLILIIILAVVGFVVEKYFLPKDTDDLDRNGLKESFPEVGEGLSIHFLELGNGYNGDCIYIKAGDDDILIDAGSRKNSVDTISTYLNHYISDDTIEYVIATHAHQDHIAAFTGNDNLFDRYQVETIIDYPLQHTTSQTSQDYREGVEAEVLAGATHFTALECVNETGGAKKIFNLDDGVTLEILYQKYYEEETDNENNYSVCVLVSQGERHCLFTGDLEEEGELSLLEHNPTLPKIDVFKAGHHGSNTSNCAELLDKITPEIIVVTCVAGSVEFTDNLDNTFPKQSFIDVISEYCDFVYVTSMCDVVLEEDGDGYDNLEAESLNGNIVIDVDEDCKVFCSAETVDLNDTEWFEENRDMPEHWQK